MKSKEELNALKEEIENISMKLNELTEEELEQVFGGISQQGIIKKYQSQLWDNAKIRL